MKLKRLKEKQDKENLVVGHWLGNRKTQDDWTMLKDLINEEIAKVRKESYEAGRGSVVVDSNGFIQETMIPKAAFDLVRKETAKCVCDRMIKEISDLRKAETSDEEEKIWNFGYDWRIKEEKEIKKQIIKEL